jgi:hypothetical protein
MTQAKTASKGRNRRRYRSVQKPAPPTPKEFPHPRASRQRPRKRGEDRSIDGTQPRSPRLPTQNRQLVPEQHDLEFLGALRSAQQHGELNQTAERQIDER